MVGWHHRLNGSESERTPGDSEEQGSLRSTGRKGVGHDSATEQEQALIYSRKIYPMGWQKETNWIYFTGAGNPDSWPIRSVLSFFFFNCC